MMIAIDGTMGEGGGQILRTSLTLAAVAGQAVRITGIRAGRSRPGLMRQHLTGARAVAEVCGGTLDGAEVGSTTLEFRPGKIRGGEYAFPIGTAGSVILVAQTVIPVLLEAERPSRVTIRGGTHVGGAPVYEFFAETYLPALARMGAEIRCRMTRAGFYPAGGGEIVLEIEPWRERRAYSLTERGEPRRRTLTGIIANLAEGIADDEVRLAGERLAPLCGEFAAGSRKAASDGPGNALVASLEFANCTEVFSICGRHDFSRQGVAAFLVSEVKDYLGHGAPVGRYLADQLLLPLVLGAGGVFVTGEPSEHFTTNSAVIERFRGSRIAVTREPGSPAVLVTVGGQ